MIAAIGGFLKHWPDGVYGYRHDMTDFLKQARYALDRAAEADEPSCVVDDRRGRLHVIPKADLSRRFPERDAIFVYTPKRRRTGIVWNEFTETAALLGLIAVIAAWMFALAKYAPWAFIGQ